MFAHPSDKPATLPAVTLHDRALILSLSQSDNQTVWRFDLDTIAEHGFRVTGRDGFYDLALVDVDATEHLLARFLDKTEAHQTLADIHKALNTVATSTSTATPCCATGTCTDAPRRGFIRSCLCWVTFWRVVGLVAVGLLLYLLLRPMPVLLPPIDLIGEQQHQAPPANGVPLDADQLLQ